MRTTILILLWVFVGPLSGFANNLSDEDCACVDEVGSTPNEAAMYRVTTTKDSQDNYNSIFENVKK